MSVWLIGAGPMSVDYARVLKALATPFMVIGRGDASAGKFEQAVGVPVVRGGLAAYASRPDTALPEAAVVSVGVEALAPTTAEVLRLGIKRVLVEKPAGLTSADVYEIERLAREHGAAVFVGYNRRFYSAVRQAREMLAADGGVQSFQFEFTEWGHEIVGLTKAPGVKERWVLGNSSHVIDLAFHLGGVPTELHAFHAGALSWHPNAAVFAGAGRTATGAVFSYQANWDAPGRWGVEVCSRNLRCIFRPMESLQVMRKGSVAIEPQTLTDGQIDRDFKPGLYRQTEAFLAGGKLDDLLCSLAEHVSLLPIYDRIAGY